MGKCYLSRILFDNIKVFNIITLPYSDNALGDSLLMWFSIFSRMFSQFACFAYCRYSLNIIPRILVVSCCSLIVIFEAYFGFVLFHLC